MLCISFQFSEYICWDTTCGQQQWTTGLSQEAESNNTGEETPCILQHKIYLSQPQDSENKHYSPSDEASLLLNTFFLKI